MKHPLKLRWFLVALALWFLASIAGTTGQMLPREALIATSDGRGVGVCGVYNPDAVAADRAKPTEWCTADEVLGARLPDGVQSFPGDIMTGEINIDHWLNVFSRPDLWLTLGVGGSAIVMLYAFAHSTGTLRAGLAAAISLVFLGLLLFPTTFTARIPGDMRAELVTAWQWVVIFYFGSEAAVQAWKISHPGGAKVGGDPAPDPGPEPDK